MGTAARERKRITPETTVSSDEIRRNFAAAFAKAGHKDERVVITLYGKEHAALVGMKDLERLREMDRAAGR